MMLQDIAFDYLAEEENRKMVKDEELMTFINSKRRTRGGK